MFGFGEKKKRMDFLADFVPTSKAQLMRVCFFYHNGDVKKAQEMYNFFSQGIDLPDRDPLPPSLFEQVKNGVADLASFIKNNQDDLIQGYNLIHTMIKNKGTIPFADGASAAENLPPINE